MNTHPDKTQVELLSEERVDRLFCQALDLPPQQRESFLREACGDDHKLLEEVSYLVEGAEQADPLLRQGGAVAGGLLDEVQAPGWIAPGAEVGRFRVLEEIGRGGMGVVYLAERSDGQFTQKVALKVMAGGSDGQAVERFTRERQILADVEHPNIARLLDGGISETGQPYLVMEHIEGQAITRHCESLSLERRLRLLMEVCTAVEAAHRQLIVHRDLKPSNILVTEEGQVKLLDFGIAKLLDEERAASALTVARLLTPQYASPEQLRGEVITVASDVYQLGLIAYEVISGRRPYELGGLSAAEAERKVLHETPTQPSSAATAAREGIETWTGPDAKEITGDLDTIILKAIHKDPERRYGSVEQLREDLSRFLEGLPILARPDTRGYRLRKFVQRNRWAVAGASAALLTIVGLVSAFTWGLARERDQTRAAAEQAEKQRARAEEKRAESEEVLRYLVGLFEASDPYSGEIQEGELTARQLLDRGSAHLKQSFEDRPLIRARLLRTTGSIYGRMEIFEKAESLLRDALTLLEADEGDQRQEIAETLADLSTVLQDTGRLEEADAARRRSHNLLQEALGPEHPRVADSAVDLVNLLHRRGSYEEREALLRQALAIYEASETPDHEYNGLALIHQGFLLREKGDLKGAQVLFRRSLEASLAAGQPDSIGVANASKFLGLGYSAQGKHREALPLFEEALRIHELRAGPDSVNAANIIHNLAVTYYELDDLETSVRLLRRALSIIEAKKGKTSTDALALRQGLASLRHERGDAAGAEKELRLLRSSQKEALEPSHKLNAMTEIELARALIAQGKNREAVSRLEPTCEYLEATFGEKGQFLDRCFFQLGRAHRDLGEWEVAERWIRRAYELRSASMGTDSKQVKQISDELIALLREMGRESEAEALAAESKPPPIGAG